MKKTILSVLTLLALSQASFAADEKPFAIAIHGGAGTISKANLTESQIQQYKDKLTEAVNAGHRILAKGGDSTRAVQAAINVLEDSPLFNAGKGAVYTYDGGHELDASFMDGRTMNAGAVAGVRHIKNPIDLAIDVMKHSPHVMLSGSGAEEFALSRGYQLVAQEYFDTDHRYRQLVKAKQKLMDAQVATKDYQASIYRLDLEYKFGTVGAVALDKQGNLAAGTSTGG